MKAILTIFTFIMIQQNIHAITLDCSNTNQDENYHVVIEGLDAECVDRDDNDRYFGLNYDGIGPGVKKVIKSSNRGAEFTIRCPFTRNPEGDYKAIKGSVSCNKGGTGCIAVGEGACLLYGVEFSFIGAGLSLGDFRIF